jgi:hypothetical protein
MDFQQYWKINARGMCNGISILWLRHQHNTIQEEAFKSVLKVRYEELAKRVETEWRRAKQYLEVTQDKRLRDYSETERQMFSVLEHVFGDDRQMEHVRDQDMFSKVMEKMHTQGQINPLANDQEAEWARVKALMLAYGMKYDASKTFAGGWGRGHTDLGKYVTQKGTASMLHTEKHAMAACNLLGSAKFFDPNLGAVKFAARDRLGRFLSTYFKIPTVNKVYSGNILQKKLSVRADRFKYQTDRVFDLTRR